MHPLSIQIITHDRVSHQEVQHQYIVETRFPRWELFKIFVHALFHIRFS